MLGARDIWIARGCAFAGAIRTASARRTIASWRYGSLSHDLDEPAPREVRGRGMDL